MSHDPELSRLAEQLDMPPSDLAKLATGGIRAGTRACAASVSFSCHLIFGAVW